MNKEKLANMSDAQIKKACITHADRALTYKFSKPKLAQAHAKLLDECANVARTKAGLSKQEPGTAACLLGI